MSSSFRVDRHLNSATLTINKTVFELIVEPKVIYDSKNPIRATLLCNGKPWVRLPFLHETDYDHEWLGNFELAYQMLTCQVIKSVNEPDISHPVMALEYGLRELMPRFVSVTPFSEDEDELTHRNFYPLPFINGKKSLRWEDLCKKEWHVTQSVSAPYNQLICVKLKLEQLVGFNELAPGVIEACHTLRIWVRDGDVTPDPDQLLDYVKKYFTFL